MCNEYKIYVHSGHSDFYKDLFREIHNREHWVKPDGGLWASPVDSNNGWKQWCSENNFNQNIGKNKYGNIKNEFRFKLKDNVKLLYINDCKQLNKLPTINDNMMSKLYTLLDFEKLAQEYDAIEVSISSDFELYYKLYGWDVDSILIMNPNCIDIIY